MAYSVTWDETKPDDNNYGYEIDNYIRNVLIAVRERLASEHTDVSGSGGLATMMHKWTVAAKSAGSPYTALVTDNVLLITTGASDYTINLYAASGNSGKFLKVKKVDSAAGTVIIDGSTTETIDGALTYVLSKQNQFVYLVCDGSNWHVVATNSHFDWDEVWTDAVHNHSSDAEGGVLTHPGSVVQVVYAELLTSTTGTTEMVLDDTIPQNTEGDEVLTLAITPENANNILYIEAILYFQSNVTAHTMIAALFKDTDADAISASVFGIAQNLMNQIIVKHKMVAGGVSAITFKLRAGGTNSGATTTFNGSGGARKLGGVLRTSITITEVEV